MRGSVRFIILSLLISVSAVPTPMHYVGCYLLRQSRDPRDPPTFTTLARCWGRCRKTHARFVEVASSANYCMCRPQIPALTTKVHDNLCNTRCPDDPHRTCGGHQLISVYYMQDAAFGPAYMSSPASARSNPVHPSQQTLNGQPTYYLGAPHHSHITYPLQAAYTVNSPGVAYTYYQHNSQPPKYYSHQLQSPPSVATTGPARKGCVLPEASPMRRFCSVDAGCEHCDFQGGGCHVTPGSQVRELGVVKVVCAPGFAPEACELSVCLTSGWHRPPSQCLRLCSPLQSDTLIFECIHGADTVPCSKPALPGTVLSFRCPPGHKEYVELNYQGAYRNTVICTRHGKWSSHYLPSCQADCGFSKEYQKIGSAIFDGVLEGVGGIFPWHADIYYLQHDVWSQRCSGSLITNQVVLTAAHCVVCQATDGIQVVFGKKYRSWDIYEPTVTKRNVVDIVIPDLYNPHTYILDIALLLLSEQIRPGENIMPVCRSSILPPNHHYNSFVVGWRNKTSKGSRSEALHYNDVALMLHLDCYKSLPFHYYLGEKLCAIRNNSGFSLQRGDSGGGLYFVDEDGRHFIGGIISMNFMEKDIPTFTNMMFHVTSEFVDNEIQKWTNKVSYEPVQSVLCTYS